VRKRTSSRKRARELRTRIDFRELAVQPPYSLAISVVYNAYALHLDRHTRRELGTLLPWQVHGKRPWLAAAAGAERAAPRFRVRLLRGRLAAGAAHGARHRRRRGYGHHLPVRRGALLLEQRHRLPQLRRRDGGRVLLRRRQRDLERGRRRALAAGRHGADALVVGQQPVARALHRERVRLGVPARDGDGLRRIRVVKHGASR